MDLTEAAMAALQVGQVGLALRYYRELEWRDEKEPTWSLRAAECYRRLAQREGEVLALMRAASRFEHRGFVRHALALWTRVQAAVPDHPGAAVAVERLRSTDGLGLQRLSSSVPPNPAQGP